MIASLVPLIPVDPAGTGIRRLLLLTHSFLHLLVRGYGLGSSANSRTLHVHQLEPSPHSLKQMRGEVDVGKALLRG
jgi:hypothetical protein